ncbi:TonB-dependent receptor [Porticoccus sp. W117]|uniref:TonB-dependent receptor n=1 Tax=Porticoccus sp. W117 TaxID=3054777 RepID=UPI0025942B63|nr:TonB-dependent receptor [Porticoccus sp. W117]MDM3870008.1 TonB-dependent receptor [Porticoccus sp. W117]
MKLRLLSAAIFLASTSAQALEGRILDSNGKAIDGALIDVVGKRQSATTDGQGSFTLDVDSAVTLHVSAPGFVHKTIYLDSGDVDNSQRIVLSKSAIEQIDVIGIPLHASSIESALPINVLLGEELRNKQAATLGDSLAGEVGVNTNFHGNVASTPIIRGLSGPRVLITQNSLDVSDVSRVGPDHTVATEVSTSERLEVLRGPATLFFGSGAIGGVVNVVDKRVPTGTEAWSEWLLSHDSVNNQDLASLNLNTGSGNVAFHLDGFWRQADDYEVPVSPEIDEDHGERTVASTAEESSGYTLGTSYLLDNGYVGLSVGQLERDYGIPCHSHGEEEHEEGEHDHDEAEEEVILDLKQDRYQLISELAFDSTFINALNTRVGYTDYAHTEFENGTTGTTFTNQTSEIKLEFLHQTLAEWNGGLVFDYKTSEFSAVGEEAFAPPSKTDAFAIALVEERRFGDVLLQLGARAEHVTVKSDEVSIGDVEFHHHDEEGEEHGEEGHGDEEHGAEIFSFNESYTPISLSAGAVWDFAPGYNVGISLSHSERAPSAAELLSFGPHIATGTFEIGALFEAHEDDGELHFEPLENAPRMEKSNNIDITFRKFEGNIGVVLNAFYNQVDNYYAQFDTELFAESDHDHGDEEGGEEDVHGGELPVFLFQSADVSLSGFEAQGIWQINPQFKTTLYTDYVRAKLDEGGNLPRIPPMRVGASFDYEHERLSASLSWTRYSDQDDVAVLETETDGYDWVSANVNYRIPFGGTELTLFVKADNLMDEEARVHSSFLKNLAPRPGRNFRVGIRSTF